MLINSNDSLRFRGQKIISDTVLFIFAFLLIYVFITRSNITNFPFDSKYYWEVSDKFIGENGIFGIANFKSDLRGYFYPFIIFIIKAAASLFNIDKFQVLKIFNSLMFATIASVVVPLFIENNFKKKFNIFSKILLIVIMFYFWRGSFNYPLSDFPAVLFLLISLLFYYKIFNSEKNLLKMLFTALSGFFIYLAYNTRSIYIIVGLAGIIFLIFCRQFKISLKIILILFFISGFLISSIPQVIINYHSGFQMTPFIKTIYKGEDLLFHMLRRGIGEQKYETNINTTIYPYNAVIFIDPLGEKIDLSSLNSYIDYIKLFLKNPLSFIIIYFHHLFNGIDIYFPDVYVANILGRSKFFSLFNYTLWFILLFTIIKKFEKINREFFKNKTTLFLFLLPVVALIPLQPETRFYLPIFLVCYGFLCLNIGYLFKYYDINLTEVVKSRKNFTGFFIKVFTCLKKRYLYIIKVIIVYIIFVIICFTLSFYTFLNIKI